MIVGFSNAVNLTDGLDGLAIMPTVLVSGALGVFAYLAGNKVFSEYLGIPSIPGAGELAIFTGALAGAGLGFLWFNTYPAQRSEEHTSELQSLMRISYAVFCLKKNTQQTHN